MRYLPAIAACSLALAACGERPAVSGGAEAAGGAARARQAATSLADVAGMCSAPTESGPGVAVVTTELRDANVTVDLPDCIIHLEQGADVTLNNVTITGGILNVHDRATPPSPNRITLQRVTMTTAALLVELNDAEDTVDVEATSITTAHGIGIRVAGTHDGGNEGGRIDLVGSSLLATDVDATVHVVASEHSGSVRLVNTSVDTRGPLIVLAATCSARLDGEQLDCSTAAAAADLGG